MSLKSLIPKPLKYPLISFYILGRLILRGIPAKEPRLNLANVLPPIGSSKIIHGGKVKLLALRERFGDTWRNFNLAYFVSSGLPFAPAIWIRLYKFFGIKVVWNQNGFAYPALYSSEVIGSIHSLFKPIHLTHFVVYQTEFTKRCAQKFLGEIKNQSTVLINPVDTKEFKPRKNALPLEPLTIIMLGNHFESEERMTVSIESLKLLRTQGVDLKLIIIGRCEKQFGENWIEKRGAYLQKDAPTLFQSAHLMLHLKYLDPCPTAVLEALASGLPVIGSRSGGMPELVDDASGVLISAPEDFEKLHYPTPGEVTQAIIKVRDNLSEYSRSARAQALKFDKEIWLEKHDEIFKTLLK
jgi:glycosyltransferase involved in cell wall biosynthesis